MFPPKIHKSINFSLHPTSNPISLPKLIVLLFISVRFGQTKFSLCWHVYYPMFYGKKESHLTLSNIFLPSGKLFCLHLPTPSKLLNTFCYYSLGGDTMDLEVWPIESDGLGLLVWLLSLNIICHCHCY